MNTLDRLNSYSADVGYVPQGEKKLSEDGIFDISKPEGAYLYALHKRGYKMYNEDGTWTELYTALTTDGNQRIQASAGSGKTTMMIFKIIHDIVTWELMRDQLLPNGNVVKVMDKVFVGTFLKSGSDELRSKLIQWQKSLGYTSTAMQINFGTLHAEFKRCLNAMGVDTPIGSPAVLNRLLVKAINMCNITRNGNALTQEDYKIIESILIYYRGRIDSKKYQHPSVKDYDLTPSILDLLAKQYSQLRQAEGVMDFEDLQELLYKYLYVTPNPNVQDFVANRYSYIYLDEFQDTSQIQYEILKVYARGWTKDTDKPTKGKIVVVGDVEQCIYSFRGSCIEVMHEMFNNDFDAVNNRLSFNYRCPSNILKPIVTSIDMNPESEGIDIKPFNEGGIFNAYTIDSITTMLRKLEKDLDEDLDSGMDIAILCRTNYDGMIPALYLEMLGKFNFSISSEAMTLNSALPRRMKRVGKLFTEKGTPAIKDVLTLLVPYTSQYNARKVADVLKTNRMSIFDMDENDLNWEVPTLYSVIVEIKKVRKTSGDVEALKYTYKFIRSMFTGDSSYCEAARACIDVFLFMLGHFNFNSVYEFNERLEEVDEGLLARVGKNLKITISTVHEFKGKERDSVIVWNDSEGVFPASKTDTGNIEQVCEERRVHYIACTRAKKKSTIYTRSGKEGMFLKEMDTTLKPYTCITDKVNIKELNRG